jgi:hypothetical protein
MLQSTLDRNLDLTADHAETSDGVYLGDLPRGSVLEIETAHRNYRLVKNADAHVRISGHPLFCPVPTDVEIEGSFSTGLGVKGGPGFIGRGMHMIFKHPVFDRITTSEILEIHRLG